MKKRKWLKRILLSLSLLFILIVAVVITLAYMTGSRPDWYRSRNLGAAEVKQNLNSAINKLNTMQNWVQDQSNWSHVATRPRVDTDPSTAPVKSQTITLSEDELNALLSTQEKMLLERYGHAISDPYLGLRDGHLILAVTHKGSGRVVSVHVKPALDDKGMLLLSTGSLMAGRIPVPKALWSNYTDTVTNQLSGKLEHAREQAHLEADGTGNPEAVISAMSRLVLNSLKERGSDPVLFLQHDMTNLDTGYPVKVVDIKVANQSLSLTFVTLTAVEQQSLLSRLRAPLGEEPPPPISASGATATPPPG